MPLAPLTDRPVQARFNQGIGARIPRPREADCSGRRPAWYPFVFNVCDVDSPPPRPLTEREMRIPPPR